MTATDESHEAKVANFYDEDTGEGAGLAYTRLMGQVWHHGDAQVEKAGGSLQEAAEAMQRRLLRYAQVGPGDRVLDFGSGPGGASVAMAAISGAVFVGVSNTESLSRRARRFAADRAMSDRATFLTIGDLDYRTLQAWPDGSFDAVMFLESVCHLPDKQAFFHAAHRVLRPGGKLVGLDWVQRPWGDYQTAEQRAPIIGPVCEYIRLAGLGTVRQYAQMMQVAGFEVEVAADEFEGELCWGSTPPDDQQGWLRYGPSGNLFHDGKQALDRARGAGVFSVAWWAATRRAAVKVESQQGSLGSLTVENPSAAAVPGRR
ncbi:SAM-dependent methyltransferase [Actinoplanes subtropicus]|uniref:SAM-dependent methyltransferase n=1 Tax=Actinoplanes subtropicus TaxID=543632 RepID=UPI0004C3E528|nr:methyltransferase domain-containing protein [Actinoplanes subtropicus]